MAKTESDTDEEKSAELLYTRFIVVDANGDLLKAETKAVGRRMTLLDPLKFHLFDSLIAPS